MSWNERRWLRSRLASQASAIALAALAAFGIASTHSAHAAGIVFTFDAVKNGSGVTIVSGLTDSSTNSAVSAYMNAVVKLTNAAYGVVSLSDATKGAEGETNYTGDNHVVGLTVGPGKDLTTAVPTCPSASQPYACGPSGSTYKMISNNVVPLTLGNTDGFIENGTSSGKAQLGNANPYSPNGLVGHLTTFDAYITNDVNNSNPDKTTMAFQFSGGLLVSTLEFDFQIFPDSSCATASCSAGLPDLTLKYKDQNGVMQTVLGTPLEGETPDGDTHSPVSGTGGTELTPQLLSHALFILPEATSEVWFVDWPATIGIDNLCINCSPPPPPRINTPEPTTLAIFGIGLAGLAIPMWRRRRVHATA